MNVEIFDHCIVGGGVSGIYIAMQLFQKKENFILLEKYFNSDEIGKIRSMNVPVPSKPFSTTTTNHTFELGPSIFHTNQKRFSRLLQFLELDTKVKTFDKGTTDLIYKGFTPEQASAHFDLLKKRVKNASLNAKTQTLDDIAQSILTSKDYAFFKTCWSCWYENSQMNAKAYFQSEEQEGQYAYLQGGLSQITQQAQSIFRNLYRTGIIVDSVEDKGYYFLVSYYKNNDKSRIFFIRCRHLYICTSLENCSEIKFKHLPLFRDYCKLGKTLSSLRFFTILHQPIDYPKNELAGQIESRWILKHTKRIWLGPYVDGQSADFMMSLGKKELEDRVLHDLKQPRENLLKSIGAYWKHAFTILKPEFYSHPHKLFTLIPDRLYSTVLPHPNDQAWMEGHLFDIP